MESWGRGVVALGVMLAAVLVCVQSVSVPSGDLTIKRCGPVCANYCPFGRVYRNGCPTCTCRRECPLVRCQLWQRCPNGFKKINGCPTCECNGIKICPAIRCLSPFRHCPNGYETDANGCRTCQCKKRICPLVKCRPCPNGYVWRRGCQTCECKKPVCPMLKCKACPFGYVWRDNCQTCQCRKFPICPRIACPLKRYCRYGYETVNGCPSCRCKGVRLES